MSGITSKRLYPSIVMKAALNIVSNINDDAENILSIQKEINSLNNSIEEN